MICASSIGLAENPVFAYKDWDDVLCERVEELTILDQAFIRVRGNFWEPDWELRFFAKGRGNNPNENWIRTLEIAIQETPKLADRLFSPVTLVFPSRWFAPCEIKPGLSVLEKRYRRYLSVDYKGLGVPGLRPTG